MNNVQILALRLGSFSMKDCLQDGNGNKKIFWEINSQQNHRYINQVRTFIILIEKIKYLL